MDPVSIAASVIGIVAPALYGVRLVVGDIQRIVDAPDAVKSLEDDLLAVDKALTSLQAVSDPQWESLGEAVLSQSKAATTSCRESCDKFRTALGRWTRHSNDGKLFWQDRAKVGFFKQGYIKSMSEQLQTCKVTFTSVVSIATLHSTLRQSRMTEDMIMTVSKKETEIADSIAATDKQLAEVNAKLGSICLAGQDEGETEDDRASAISQVAVEQATLGDSRKLLEELLSGIQAADANARKDQVQVVNTFGSHNEGMQIGVSHGAISNITFGKK